MDTFWDKVDQKGPEECWEWWPARENQYGKYWLNGERMGAHRAAWTLTNGPIPVGIEVCHSCDNPRCVNPAHLFLGTHQDNMRDAYTKGRIVQPPGRPQRGERNGSAKLTEADVFAIRARHHDGETQTGIAQDFPVSQQQICDIVHRKCWTHI